MFKDAWPSFRHLRSRRALAYASLALVIFFLFFWRLNSFVPGLSTQEAASRTSSMSLRFIMSHPIDAPYRVVQHFFLKVSPLSLTALRMSSAIFACVIGLFFYKLAAHWFGKLIGLFGSLIFITLPLFIIAGRQGTSQIMLFTPIILMSLYAWLAKTEKYKTQAWVLLVLSSAVLAFTPGLIWFILISLLVSHKRLVSAISSVKPWISALALATAAAILVPLVLSLIAHPETIKQLFLVPASWPAPMIIIKNIAWMVLALIVKTPHHFDLILGRLPLLNVLVLALIVFGVYAMQVAARAKALWLIASTILAITAAGLINNELYLALTLPALCLLASAGLRYLYIEWRSIFPRNPVPKNFAIVLISLVTLSQTYFGVRYALIAWPHSVATRTSYVLK